MDWNDYSKIILTKCKDRHIPYHGCFELTPLCNFKCNMCYVRLNPDQAKKQGTLLSTDQWIDLARQAKKMGMLSLEVTGGEAITRQDFPILYKAFIKMGFFVNLRTNGYLINNKILNLLSQYKPRQISITLYGASDAMYNKVCSVPDGFSVVTNNILALKEAGLNIRLTMTVTKDNVDDLPVLELWAENNGLVITPFGGLVTPVRSAKRSIQHLKIRYDDKECDIPENLSNINYEVSDRESLMNPFWMCRAFGATYCVSWDGRLTLCNTLTDVWTNPLIDGLDKAYHDLYYKLDKIRRPEECLDCTYIEFCGACPSQLMSVTGNMESTNEEICRLARRKYKRHMMLLEEKGFKDLTDNLCE